MSRRPSRCRCCLRPAASTYCEPCGQERSRAEFGIKSVVWQVWGDDGVARLAAALRARRLRGARRGRERRPA